MSTVKLVTPYNKELHDKLKGLPVRVLIVGSRPNVNYDTIARRIFSPYKGKLVIFGQIARGILPVGEWVYRSADDVARAGIDSIVYGVMHNSGTRVYSGDEITYYDVYRVWHECRNIVPIRKSVIKILMKMYGTTDVRGLAPWASDSSSKTIGEMTEADDDYKRIMGADLSYPIIIRYNGSSVDGLHRLMKCALTGRKYIYVIIIPYDKLRKCKIDGNIDDYSDRF